MNKVENVDSQTIVVNLAESRVNEFAPVVIFCYTRLDLLKKTVAALLKNKEAEETDVFFYSDGGRDEISWEKVWKVRKYLYTISGFKKVTVVEQKENRKLEFNVIQGITEVVEKYGRVIVVEDDILVSKYFLSFMNRALKCYESYENVMGVSGFNPCNFPKDFPDTFAWRFPMSLGWGTWNHKWRKFRHYHSANEILGLLSNEDKYNLELGGVFPCLQLLEMNPIPWDICWHIAVYLSKGVCIAVRKNMVRHTGNNGTHFSSNIIKDLFYKIPFETKHIYDISFICLTTDVSRNLYAEEIFKNYLLKFEKETFLLKSAKAIIRLFGVRCEKKIRDFYHKFFQ